MFFVFKNVEDLLLSSRAVKKQAVGRVWPVGHSLPTPAEV